MTIDYESYKKEFKQNIEKTDSDSDSSSYSCPDDCSDSDHCHFCC